jgi:hypothetical protein
LLVGLGLLGSGGGWEQEAEQEAGQEHPDVEPEGLLGRAGEDLLAGVAGGSADDLLDALAGVGRGRDRPALGLLAACRDLGGVLGGGAVAGAGQKAGHHLLLDGGGHARGLQAAAQPGVTCSALAVAWLASRPKKITPITATPTALPSCWAVFNTPDAEPASWGGTPASTVSVSGGNTRPMPMPPRPSRGTSCQPWMPTP